MLSKIYGAMHIFVVYQIIYVKVSLTNKYKGNSRNRKSTLHYQYAYMKSITIKF